MALQQRIRIYLEIVGDGSSTTFSFEPRDLYGLNVNTTANGTDVYPFLLINPASLPSLVEIGSTFNGTAPSSASISGKQIILTWATAPASGSDNKFQLFLDYSG